METIERGQEQPAVKPGNTSVSSMSQSVQRGKLIAVLVAGAVLALASAGVVGWLYGAAHQHNPSLVQGTEIDRMTDRGGGLPPAVATPGNLPNFSGIVEAYGPAVVNIQVAGFSVSGIANPDAHDNPLFRLLPRFGLPVPQQPVPQQSVPSKGEGSGFIVSADGVILTNAHVVDGAREVIVKLTDRREFKAKVVGVDRLADLAVLRIKAMGLPTVHLAKAEPVQVGEWVLAIGSPFGFENSASAGIVSGKARALPDESYVPFIQTDVAVNPGNSGGPLFNQRGEVVGINSQIFSRTGGYQGLSFAIPIDVAEQVMDQILRDGKVTRGRLGVTIQEMNMNLAQSFSLSKPTGALISAVEPGSPAQRAGLKSGDVILAVHGQAIGAANDLPPLIAAMKPGTSTDLTLWRDKQETKVNVRVGELAQVAQSEPDNPPESGHLGLAVRPLSPEEREQAGIGAGLLVLGVTGPAQRAGIQDGDIVLALNGVPVPSVEVLRVQAEKAGKHIALLLQRDDTQLFVPLNLSEGG